MNDETGEHWEDPNEASVKASVDLYYKNKDEQAKAAEAAAKAKAEPGIAEFGTSIPTEPDTFVHSVATSGKAVAPVLSTDAPGAVPEPSTVEHSAGNVTLSEAQFQALLTRGQGAEPEPPQGWETVSTPVDVPGTVSRTD